MRKEIILVRHALVDVNKNEKISAKDLKAWVEKYDVTALHPKSIPSEELHKVVNEADFLVTSTLIRAIKSANFFEKKIDEQNALFNELLLPHISIPYFKFKARTWLIILRLILFFAKNEKEYIENALNQLLQYSQENNRVVLIGHGGLNYYLYKALLKEGWTLVKKPSHKNWGMTRLYKV